MHAAVEAHHVQLLSGRWTVEYRVVVEGYGIVGSYSTREKAERHANQRNAEQRLVEAQAVNSAADGVGCEDEEFAQEALREMGVYE